MECQARCNRHGTGTCTDIGTTSVCTKTGTAPGMETGMETLYIHTHVHVRIN